MRDRFGSRDRERQRERDSQWGTARCTHGGGREPASIRGAHGTPPETARGEREKGSPHGFRFYIGVELNGPDRTGSLLPSPALCPRNATQHSPSRRFVLASVGCRCALLCSASALTPKPCETDFPANRSTPTRRKRNPLFVCLIVCLIRSVELTHQTLFRLLLCRLLACMLLFRFCSPKKSEPNRPWWDADADAMPVFPKNKTTNWNKTTKQFPERNNSNSSDTSRPTTSANREASTSNPRFIGPTNC